MLMTYYLLWYFESTQTDWITDSNSLLPGIFNLWICSFSKSDNPRIQHITHSFEWCTSIIPLLSIYTFCMISRGTIDLFTLCSPVAWHSIAQKTVYKSNALDAVQWPLLPLSATAILPHPTLWSCAAVITSDFASLPNLLQKAEIDDASRVSALIIKFCMPWISSSDTFLSGRHWDFSVNSTQLIVDLLAIFIPKRFYYKSLSCFRSLNFFVHSVMHRPKNQTHSNNSK